MTSEDKIFFKLQITVKDISKLIIGAMGACILSFVIASVWQIITC